jgi:hypothetical protein
MLNVATALMAGVLVASDSDAGSDPQVESVRNFLSTMSREVEPTIADFRRLFGPHDESELILQLRLEGLTDPLHVTPSDETLERVNKRFQSPGEHRSLFLCFLRRRLPGLRDGDWAVTPAQRDTPEGFRVLKAEHGSETLFFEFADGEPAIERLLDRQWRHITAEGYLPSCKAGSCCPGTPAMGP